MGCLKIKSLPARRHHADRRVGPARAEAAAVVAAAIESGPAPAVADVAVVIDVARFAPRRLFTHDRHALALRQRWPVARQVAIAVPALGMHRDLGALARRGVRARRCRQQQSRGDGGDQQNFPASHHAAFDPQSRWLAIAAPSPSAFNFAQTMLSATIGSVRTAVPKPQSTPAITRSRPTISAYRPMRCATSFGCSTKFVVESITPGMRILSLGILNVLSSSHSWSWRGLAASMLNACMRALNAMSMILSSGRSKLCGPS